MECVDYWNGINIKKCIRCDCCGSDEHNLCKFAALSILSQDCTGYIDI